MVYPNFLEISKEARKRILKTKQKTKIIYKTKHKFRHKSKNYASLGSCKTNKKPQVIENPDFQKLSNQPSREPLNSALLRKNPSTGKLLALPLNVYLLIVF